MNAEQLAVANLVREYANDLFYYCVDLLYVWADALGITYEEINVLLFCVLWPIVTIVLAAMVVRGYLTNKRLRSSLQK